MKKVYEHLLNQVNFIIDFIGYIVYKETDGPHCICVTSGTIRNISNAIETLIQIMHKHPTAFIRELRYRAMILKGETDGMLEILNIVSRITYRDEFFDEMINRRMDELYKGLLRIRELLLIQGVYKYPDSFSPIDYNGSVVPFPHAEDRCTVPDIPEKRHCVSYVSEETSDEMPNMTT